MKLLAIDTSGSSLSAAIAEATPPAAGQPLAANIIGSFGVNTGRNHSLALLPMLQALLDNCGLDLAHMDAFAVTLGPGSFTGLRIGCATVRAWGQALEKPLIGISSTQACALAASPEGWVCPIFDARRNEVYTALFHNGQRQWEDRALAPQRLIQELAALGQPVLCSGDAWPVYAALFEEQKAFALRPQNTHSAPFLAEAAAQLALEQARQGQFTPAEQLLPRYLRLSEAEEKRLAQQATAQQE